MKYVYYDQKNKIRFILYLEYDIIEEELQGSSSLFYVILISNQFNEKIR